MNKQPCEDYIEWMSLAQDGMLSSTQSRLLHTHIAECNECQVLWKAMTAVSLMFHAQSMAEPASGFVARFEARLAYRQEQRRRAIVWLLLGVGVIALTLLALPSLFAALSLTGRLVLPYPIVAYIQNLANWGYVVANALADTAWLLIRYACTGPAAPACWALLAVAGGLVATWTRFLVRRMAGQRTA